MIQVVLLDLWKLCKFWCLEAYFTETTADSGGIFIFIRRNRSTERMMLLLIVAFFADDVSEGVQLLFCLIDLLLQITKRHF